MIYVHFIVERTYIYTSSSKGLKIKNKKRFEVLKEKG